MAACRATDGVQGSAAAGWGGAACLCCHWRCQPCYRLQSREPSTPQCILQLSIQLEPQQLRPSRAQGHCQDPQRAGWAQTRAERLGLSVITALIRPAAQSWQNLWQTRTAPASRAGQGSETIVLPARAQSNAGTSASNLGRPQVSCASIVFQAALAASLGCKLSDRTKFRLLAVAGPNTLPLAAAAPSTLKQRR